MLLTTLPGTDIIPGEFNRIIQILKCNPLTIPNACFHPIHMVTALADKPCHNLNF